MAEHTGKYVSYLRVSTQRQGQSGLGLDAQRQAVQSFLNGGSWELIAEFQEVETGKGSNALHKRPVLKLALDACREHGATLLIAKLDRLSRNVRFIAELLESNIPIKAADMPDANGVMLHIMAALAEHERTMISERTKAALAVAKARGVVLGSPTIAQAMKDRAKDHAERFRFVFVDMRREGFSQRRMVAHLNAKHSPTPSGTGKQWSLIQVQRTLKRLDV